jgi:hypothetical protein
MIQIISSIDKLKSISEKPKIIIDTEEKLLQNIVLSPDRVLIFCISVRTGLGMDNFRKFLSYARTENDRKIVPVMPGGEASYSIKKPNISFEIIKHYKVKDCHPIFGGYLRHGTIQLGQVLTLVYENMQQSATVVNICLNTRAKSEFLHEGQTGTIEVITNALESDTIRKIELHGGYIVSEVPAVSNTARCILTINPEYSQTLTVGSRSTFVVGGNFCDTITILDIRNMLDVPKVSAKPEEIGRVRITNTCQYSLNILFRRFHALPSGLLLSVYNCAELLGTLMITGS